MRKLALSFCFGFLFSCSQHETTPDYIIPEDEFVEILTEFQKTEAFVRLGFNRTKDSILLNDSVYLAFFRKHNISEATFDSNFTYYSKKPKEFEKMYDRVLINLSTQSAELLENSTPEPIDSVK